MTVTRDKLLELAKEAGANLYSAHASRELTGIEFTPDQLERFAAGLLEAQEGEPDAWLFKCTKPGIHTVHASMDENDTNHWPLDQWTKVEKYPLYTTPPSSDQVWNEAITKFLDIVWRTTDHESAQQISKKVHSLKRPSQAQEPKAVGAADGFGPDQHGCCMMTVTQRCVGCPHNKQEPHKADGTFVHCGDSHQIPYAASNAEDEPCPGCGMPSCNGECSGDGLLGG